jgi:hypothetical protein
MHRRIALFAVLAPLALPAASGAAPAPGAFFTGASIDGPGADIQRLGDLDVARDGTGALAYVKSVGGVDHIFVSRLVDGAFQAPEQVDAGLTGPGSQPRVAVSDGGNLVVAFVSSGTLLTVTRPAGASTYSAPQVIGAGASNPDLAMSINRIAYLTWSSGGTVVAARKDRTESTFAGLPSAMNIDPSAVAGTGTGGPRVAVAADGVATVVWGEGGHLYARRLFELRPSDTPQDLGAGADQADLVSEDDSSFAWVVFRQDGRAVARRLVGSAFDPPVVIDGGEPAESPRVAISGRGVGYGAVAGTMTGSAFGAVLKDDVFNPGIALGGGLGAGSAPVPAAAETGDGLVAYQQGDGAGGRAIHARYYDYDPLSRAVTQPGADATLSDPTFGNADAIRGLEAHADRVGDVVVAFVQGEDAGRRIVAAGFDRAPGTFRGLTGSRIRNFARSPLKWSTPADLWGPLTYTVLIDGRPATQTQSTAATLPPTILDGRHKWRVLATDLHGQESTTPPRTLRMDGRPPKVSFRISGARKHGGLLRVTARARDAGTAAKASGLRSVRISFGDGSAAVGKQAVHSYRHSGQFTVKVTATDNVGNAAVVQRRIHIS